MNALAMGPEDADPPSAAVEVFAAVLAPVRTGLASLDEIWNMVPVQRGKLIEDILAETDYKDWHRVGAENNGKFPLVDFQQGDNLVSLKTVDTRGSGWMSDMRSEIRSLSGAREVNGVSANMGLDIRVQPGGAAAAAPLITYGE
jgi:filamentous hemagglutinin